MEFSASRMPAACVSRPPLYPARCRPRHRLASAPAAAARRRWTWNSIFPILRTEFGGCFAVEGLEARCCSPVTVPVISEFISGVSINSRVLEKQPKSSTSHMAVFSWMTLHHDDKIVLHIFSECYTFAKIDYCIWTDRRHRR